ncbi:T17B22.18 protein [Striga asiatica]|uniref:T17B22.18 protein n=1 Tax=Striga asiatica TaxID=4170 RepID=A0A5A7QTV6_STRAF|nr:T17B22.18 protein [Striga asiatica]
MDFHSLTRRELQALCKKNKIPANITNVAMAEALQALKIVEGIEELMQTSQSGTAQSSMESLEMAEVTSPFVPPIASRSTRRTNITKEAPESVNPTTRISRTTRKAQFKDADVTETPAMLAQTKKKGPMTSACRKMDSQFMECVDEGKKGTLVTPAATSRRKRVEDSTVKSTYNTRRSSRLAEKNNVMLNEVDNEESQISKKKLVALEKNLKYGVEDFTELSGITDVDAMTGIEEKFEDKDEPEVVSVQKQETSLGKDESGDVSGQKVDTSTGEEIEDVDAVTAIEEKFEDKDEAEAVSVQEQETSIGKDESEDVPGKKLDTSTYEEIELGTHAQEEKFTNLENEDCGENTVMLLTASNEVLQQSNVSQDVCISEAETIVQKNIEELKCVEASEAADFVNNLNLESGVAQNVCNSETKTINQKNIEELNSKEREASEDEAADFVENVILECGEVDEDCPVATQYVCPSESETTVEKNIDELEAEEGEASRVEDADSVESEDNIVVDDNAGFQSKDDEEFENDTTIGGSEDVQDLNATLDKLTVLTLKQATEESISDFTHHLDISVQLKENEHNVVEVVQLETENAAYIIADSNFIDHSGASVQLNDDEPKETDIHQNETKPTDPVPGDKSYADFCEQILKSDSEKLGTEPEETNECTKLESPVSKSLTKTKSRACFSDNKENFSSGGKLIIVKDERAVKKKVEDAKDLKDLSLRKLTKMFKEKLEISKKGSQNENGSEAITRPALQAISENRLVDETQN